MEAKKIGVYICHCGSNIADYVDIQEVKKYVETLSDVHIVKDVMFACADSSQKEIEEDIKQQQLDAIIIASCSPKLHLATFRNVAKRAGLNPYKYVQVNIREQCSWAHSDNPKAATEKAKRLIKAGIQRVKYATDLEPIKIPAKNAVAVIGAGVAGMKAAIELADMGSYVYLIEREYFVGGRISQWNELFTTDQTGREIVTKLYKKITEYSKIILFTGAEVIDYSGSVGNFNLKVRIKPRYVKPNCKFDPKKLDEAIEVCPVEVDDEFNFGLTKRKAIYKNYPSEFPEIPAIDADHCTRCGECVKICPEIDLTQKEEILDINVGAVVLTTGFDPYEPKKGEYGYGEIENVITLQQFKRLIELCPETLEYKGKKIKRIAYIYCVGSRQQNGENKYCSRYCCTAAMHTGILVKKKYGDIENFHFNRGIRTYGKQEPIYHQALSQGDILFQSYDDPLCEVIKNNGSTYVRIKDFLTKGEVSDLEVDLVVLVTGMVPRKNNTVGKILKVPTGRDKFFNEIHLKLRPVETVIDGVFIAGASQGPKNITESVKSALSAASKANTLVSKGYIPIEPTIAVIDKDKCTWCGKCAEICPFDAISKQTIDGKEVAVLTEAKCKGCGMCMPVCEPNAIQLKGYTDNEIELMIDALANV